MAQSVRALGLGSKSLLRVSSPAAAFDWDRNAVELVQVLTERVTV